MVIVCNFDGPYADFGKALYSSIRQHAPHAVVFFEMFNLCQKDLDSFRRVQRPLQDVFMFSNMSFSDDLERIDFMANRRVYLIQALLARDYQDILWLDADSLVVRDPSGLFHTHFDISAFEPGEVPGRRTRFLISTLAIKNSARSRRFVDVWAAMTLGAKSGSDICRVQECFCCCYEDAVTDVVLFSLPRVFSDYEFNLDSFIWEAHSTRKTNDVRWLNANRNFLFMFESKGR